MFLNQYAQAKDNVKRYRSQLKHKKYKDDVEQIKWEAHLKRYKNKVDIMSKIIEQNNK